MDANNLIKITYLDPDPLALDDNNGGGGAAGTPPPEPPL